MTEHKKMVVVEVSPPIPWRNFDWCAYWDGEEEDGRYGWGKTGEEAVQDLLDRDND